MADNTAPIKPAGNGLAEPTNPPTEATGTSPVAPAAPVEEEAPKAKPIISGLLIMPEGRQYPHDAELRIKILRAVDGSIVYRVELEPRTPSLMAESAPVIEVNEQDEALLEWLLTDPDGDYEDRKVVLVDGYDESAIKPLHEYKLDGCPFKVLKPGDHKVKVMGKTTYSDTNVIEFTLRKPWPKPQWVDETPMEITMVQNQPFELNLGKLVKDYPGELKWEVSTSGLSHLKGTNNVKFSALNPGTGYATLTAKSPDGQSEITRQATIQIERKAQPTIVINPPEGKRLDKLVAHEAVTFTANLVWSAHILTHPAISSAGSSFSGEDILLRDGEVFVTNNNQTIGLKVLPMKDGSAEVNFEFTTPGGQSYEKSIGVTVVPATENEEHAKPTKPRRVTRPKQQKDEGDDKEKKPD